MLAFFWQWLVEPFAEFDFMLRALAGVGVLTVVAVLKHEETNIITSKIWGFATGLLK
jgi:hypothetical protein